MHIHNQEISLHHYSVRRVMIIDYNIGYVIGYITVIKRLLSQDIYSGFAYLLYDTEISMTTGYLLWICFI